MERSMIHSYYYFDTYWTPEIGLIEYIFKGTTADMGDEGFIDCCHEQIKLYETMKHTIKYILFDSTLFLYEISPVAQDWCNNNWNTYIQKNTNVSKVAAIYSDSICAQLAIEELFDLLKNTQYDVRTFSNRNDAQIWLTN